MSETYLEQAVEPGGKLLASGTWYKLADVVNCTKIEFSLYHRTFADDWWGDITHAYDAPYTGEVEYLALSVDTAKRSAAQTMYGIPDVQDVSLGSAHVIFFRWRDIDGASRIEYHGYIEGNWIHVRDIYITDRTIIPPEPDDPPDPTWEGTVPVRGRYRWFMFAYTRGNEFMPEPPIIPAEPLYAGASDGKVRKLDSSDGSTLWTSADFGSQAIGLACDPNKYVYVGAYDGRVRKLDPSDGSVIWTTTDFGTYVYSAYGLVCDLDGYVYVGTDDARVRKLDPSDGSVIWVSAYLAIFPHVLTCDPNGDVYVGLYDGKVRKLDSSDGSVIWTSADFGTYARGLDCDPDGYIYVGADDGKVRKLNPSDGSTLWTSADFGTYAHGLACDSNGYVYVGVLEGIVRKLDPSDGSVIWTNADFGTLVMGLACDSNGYVYAGANDGRVRKLNPSDGSTLWTSVDFGTYIQGLATTYYAGWGNK